MKVAIKLSQRDNIETDTTTYEITFTRQELMEMGKPPSSMTMTANWENSVHGYVYDERINPGSMDSIDFKLAQLAWMCAQAKSSKPPGEESVEGKGGQGEFTRRIKGKGGF